jgi:hypothetical protein
LDATDYVRSPITRCKIRPKNVITTKGASGALPKVTPLSRSPKAMTIAKVADFWKISSGQTVPSTSTIGISRDAIASRMKLISAAQMNHSVHNGLGYKPADNFAAKIMPLATAICAG